MEPEMLYKLIVLYILDKVNLPLLNSQLWNFFETQGYTNFFKFQETVSELVEANLLNKEETSNAVRYELSQEGKEALSYFKSNISDEIKEDIQKYLKENKMKIRSEIGITADYYKSSPMSYKVHCVVREGRDSLMDLSLSVADEEEAIMLSGNFSKNAQEIYAFILERLS